MNLRALILRTIFPVCENKIEKTKQFKERIQKISGDQRAFEATHSIDFSEFNDPDEAGLVSLIDYAGPVSYANEEKLILGMLAYTNFASEEQTLSDLFGVGIDGEFDDGEDDDDEFLDEEDEDIEDDPVDTINCEFHRLALRLLGIISIEESTSGALKAVIRPQMSLPTVLKDLGYEVSEDSEDGIEGLVFHPTLGLFNQAFEF